MAAFMKLLPVLALVCLSVRGEVSTEVFWRCGEDGVRPYLFPLDSSGHKRSVATPLIYGFAPYQRYILASNSPPTGSSIYYATASDSHAISNRWLRAWDVPNDNIGIEGWIQVAAAGSSGQVFGTANKARGLNMRMESSGGSLILRATASGVQVGDAFPAPATWIHCAVVRNAGMTTFYTNGIACGDSSSTMPLAPAGSVEFLAGDDGNGLNVNVDEVRIFTFAGGQFSTNDLLCNSATTGPPKICGLISSSQLQHGNAVAATTGENVTFSVPVLGALPMRYFWHGPDGLLGTNATLTVSNLTSGYDGSYYLIASNSTAAATSAVVVLTVNAWSTLAPSDGPNPLQQAQLNRRYGTFCHWGINTFLNLEWSDGTYSATNYAPPAVNVDQWVGAAWAGGSRYFMLTAKHHDGFCLWPSAFTSYSVANSGNTNDVVRLAADACAKYGLAFALYYSLWDRHEPAYTTNFYPGYFSFLTNQLTELLSNYGPICQLWFDGGFAESPPVPDWRPQELYDLVRRLQPDCCVIFNYNIGSGDGMVDWPAQAGNQVAGLPILYFPSDFRAAQTEATTPDPKQFSNPNKPGASYHLPFEISTTINSRYWFWKTNDTGPRPLNDLSNSVATTFAQTNNCVLNVAPNRLGVVPDAYTNALYQLRRSLGLQPVPVPAKIALDGRIGFNADRFEFSVQAFPGQAVVIEASTNLENWVPVQTNLTTSLGYILYSDAKSGFFTHRFYRVALLQGALPPPAIMVEDGAIGLRSNRFEFNVQALPGQAVAIEASTNLVNWVPVQTNLTTSLGQILFSDSKSGLFSRRFYRVAVLEGELPPPAILVSDGAIGLRSNRFGFNLAGIGGQKVVIQTSTNLVHWLPLQTNLLGNEPLYFTDPDDCTLVPQRFYRLVAQ